MISDVERTAIVASLMRNPLFADFSLSELERVAPVFFFKVFPAGGVILQEDDPNEGLGFVETGLLRSSKNVPHFGEKELSRLGPGDVVGEVSLVDELPHAASVRCVEESALLLSPRRRLLALFAESLPIKAKFYGIFTKTISRYLRDVNQRLHTFFQEKGALPATMRVRDPELKEVAKLGRSEIAEILQGFDVFRGLSRDEIELFTDVVHEVVLDRDEVVFREGARGDNLFLVARGSVRISKFFPGIGEEALTVLSPGEFFGDMSLFDDKPRSATAIGNADGTVLFSIARGSIESLMRRNVAGGCALYELLARIQCKRLRNTINTVSFWQILAGQSGEVGTPT